MRRVKAGVRTGVVALLAMSVFWTAAQFRAEPLLACVLAGVIVTNRKYALPANPAALLHPCTNDHRTALTRTDAPKEGQWPGNRHGSCC